MIRIEKANDNSAEVLALLGRLTYVESHGHFIEDKKDLSNYINKVFSVSKTKLDLEDPKNFFFIVYSDDLPVGYAKLVLHAKHDSVASTNGSRLERIYILNEFIPLKLGQQLLSFVEEKVKELLFDTMWLTVYIKNERAIRFYLRNEFKEVGELNFLVNGKGYMNMVLAKKV